MQTFVFSYRNPTGYSPTPETREAWWAWFESMGDHLADLGKPVVAGDTLGNCSPGTTELGGYSIIEAEGLAAALAMAKGCPHLSRGGGVEVGQLGEVPDASRLSA